MEALIVGEETFGKTVPAVAQLIHLVDAKRMYVRQRGELHAGWSEGVEAGQLAAAAARASGNDCTLSPREIAAGKDIAGVEVLVDLGNETGEIVVGG